MMKELFLMLVRRTPRSTRHDAFDGQALCDRPLDLTTVRGGGAIMLRHEVVSIRPGSDCMIVIRSERLQLRELELQDDQFILHLLNEAPFVRFIGDKGVRTLPDAREYILKGPIDSYRRFGFGLYLTALGDSGLPIGICGLVKRDTLPDADVGFAFLTQYWSRGYAAESAAAVLTYGAKALQLPRIVAITAPDNYASIAVLEKIGLRFERMVRLTENSPELKMFGPAPHQDRS